MPREQGAHVAQFAMPHPAAREQGADFAPMNESTVSARCCVRFFGKSKLGWKVSDCEVSEEVVDTPNRRSSAPRRYDATFDAASPMCVDVVRYGLTSALPGSAAVQIYSLWFRSVTSREQSTGGYAVNRLAALNMATGSSAWTARAAAVGN